MKKETFTTKINFQTRRQAVFMNALFLLLSFFIIQVQGISQCPLACDDDIQVSLDENCEATITPDMILEDPGGPCNYVVVVFGTNGLPLPLPEVNSTHVGKRLKVAVYLGNNSCWGHILVEDKLPPTIICPPNDTVFCNNRDHLLLQPFVRDNCSGVTRINLSDNTEMFDCTLNPNDSIIAKRTIRYYYVDASGNKSDTCNQCVYYKKFKQSDIVWPSDAIYSCDQFDTIPSPLISGVPLVGNDTIFPNWGVCKIAVAYEDQLIPVCPKSFKVLRKWTVLDWCAPAGQNIFTHFQIVKVIDDRGPILFCNPLMNISTDVWSCTGTVLIPPPTIVKECSRVTFQVGYKIQSPGGVPTYEGTSTANVVKLPNGYFSISGLPLGLNWVIFRATDECGNYTDCSTEVLVEDKVPPVVVCDQKTVVTLTVDGTAKIEALTFDDRSHDNCVIDRFEVKRMDNGVPCKDTARSNKWGPYVYFCCDDIGKTIMVSLRVWDLAGNSNTCMVEVEVQDKIAPFIFCPPNITVSCEYDYPDLSVFGTVRNNVADRKPIIIKDPRVIMDAPAIDGYAYDGCGVTIKEFVSTRGKCGRDTITRVFEATDGNGLVSRCTQTIVVYDFTPDNVKVTWPLDYISNTTCLNKPEISPDITGKPKVEFADRCNSIFTNYTDQVFTLDPDACVKIIRTWTVIDWCLYDPNNSQTKGYWTWKQIIKISNTVPPTIISDCRNRTVDVFGPGCAGFVDLRGRATDDCTDTLNLVWYHEVDLNNDGIIDAAFTGIGADASAVYPVGEHKITFRVKDACNNLTSCTFILNVRDGKKPTPYCNSGITTTVMPSTRSIEIWAKDFNINSEDNCTPKDSLKYYFLVNNTFVPSMIFDCSNRGKNILRIYVVDKAGNSDYCETTLEIQDPNHVCPTGLTIQGRIATQDNRSLNNTEILLERTNPAGSNITYTNASGIYSFNTVTSKIDYTVIPSKNYDFLNGVSTHDILLIQKHILGQQEFTSPYLIIAADANNSKTITAADMAELRKLVLGKIDKFTNNKSWRFVPTSFNFANPKSPFPYDEFIKYGSIGQNEMNTDFYGIKIGDVSGNADVNNLGREISSRTSGEFKLYTDQIELTAGEQITVPIFASDDLILGGIQMSLDMDISQADFVGLNSGLLNLTDENYAITDNKLKLSFVAPEAISIKTGSHLFSIVLRSKSATKLDKVLNINKLGFNSEIYDDQANLFELDLNFRTKNHTEEKPTQAVAKLYQNKPNPFSDHTVVGFEIPESQELSLVIYDLDGKVLRRNTKVYGKGYHEYIVKASDLGSAGIFYIQLNSQNFSETRKMVFIK
ncbi:MAG: T9SS type A sorting domain-containing protein [Saprospiraceae bacterium]|nr:T9SS type A sorting domain-containing protein [Candidatus Vicinibacter proximus]MBL7822309.1 T9SS type A sorting domain-containing protein [Saprospiraceae bacterium]MCC6843061.1 T9SS type A sorting domain-containing protein [Saprospiraceae bacterium]HRG31959.1 T9SS type A sorting domain-containing protein [Saprospiraceae bacterium]